MLSTLKKRIAQRLSSKDPDAVVCAAFTPAFVAAIFANLRENVSSRGASPPWRLSQLIGAAIRAACRAHAGAGAGSLAICLWNGITPGISHLFHISSIFDWK